MKASRRGSALSFGGRATTATVPSSPPTLSLSHDAISQRAYLKWQAQGCPSGTALQDWLEAETELKAELSQGRRA